jgi:hypothetical protein
MNRIVLFCEGAGDRRTSTTLGDRVLRERGPEWLAENLAHLRVWMGLEPGSEYFKWAEVRSYAAARRVRLLGFLVGRKGEAAVTHKALALAAWKGFGGDDVVVLMRDTDGDSDRRDALVVAVQSRAWPFLVVVATPHPMREAWVLAGFEPRGDEEAERLEFVRQELGFDPRKKASQLSGGRDPRSGEPAKKNAKRVLSALVEDDPAREESCWTDTPLDILLERGEESYLSDYLRDLECLLLPRLQGFGQQAP